MNKGSRRQLDQLLLAWADDHALQAEDAAQLLRRIENRIDSGQSTLVPTVPPSSPKRTRVLVAALAVAAALAIGVGLAMLFTAPKEPASDRSDDLATRPSRLQPPAASWLAHLRQQGLLLANYQDVFDHRLAWLVESEGHTQVGLLPTETAADENERQFVAIELKLMARSAGDGSWKPVRTYHVLARGEEWIELPVTDGEPLQLALWAYPVDADKISIDLRYRPSAVSTVQLESSVLQRAGEATSVSRFERGGIEYRLLQTADVLEGADLG